MENFSVPLGSLCQSRKGLLCSLPVDSKKNRKKRRRKTAKSLFFRSKREIHEKKESGKTHHEQANKRASKTKSVDLPRQNGKHFKNAEKPLKQPHSRPRDETFRTGEPPSSDASAKKLFLRNFRRSSAPARQATGLGILRPPQRFCIRSEVATTGKTPCAGRLRSAYNFSPQRAARRPPLFASG